MGIFNFATETIINNLNFTDVNGNVRPRIVEGANPQASGETVVSVLQVGKFPQSDSVSGIRTVRATKVDPVAPTKEVITFDLAGLDLDDLKGKVIQLQLDLILQGSQDGAYAQFAVHKGEPFYCEYFVKATTASLGALATDFGAILNSYFLKGDRKELNVTVAGTVITITATTPYQRFVEANSAIVQVNSAWDDAPLVIVEGEVTVNGDEGKGQYWQLVKNLRLPTLERERFGAMLQDEKPVVGGQYIQYTLFLEADRGFTGSGAVGQKLQSATAHTFFVLSTLEDDFEDFFADIIPDGAWEDPEA